MMISMSDNIFRDNANIFGEAHVNFKLYSRICIDRVTENNLI